jgi:hypothetical protein
MRLILAATTCVIISVGVAFADCPEPQGAAAEQIPDGTTATRDELAQRFNSELHAYEAKHKGD